ncbi:MAG: Do family serine endopeptidase [Planctomycetes bacterium]|nr:Do family serine endopeptidase [Planctomycetota bacterium]
MKTAGCLMCNTHKIYLARLLVAAFASLLLLLAFHTEALASDQDLEMAKAVSNSFAEVAEKAGPAVVSIKAEQERPVRKLSRGQEELFRRFFGDLEDIMPAPLPMKAQGSGFIIDQDGHVLTNNHVVENAKKITVILSDNREFQAEIVGTDPKSDLAVIKLMEIPADLPACSFGDSEQLRIGEFVIAIGAPFGFSQTVTSGIISAKGRGGIADPNATPYQNYIQTDAAINPGNSGGPLLNLDGEVIGINTAISSRSGGNEGIGFAIPANMATNIVKQLIASGEVVRGWIGVGIQEVTAELADEYEGYDGQGGVLINQVGAGLPADKAGLKANDIILAYNGITLHGPSHLQQVVADTLPGTEIPITVLRAGEEIQLTITPEVQPKKMTLASDNFEEAEEDADEVVSTGFGFEVQPLTDEIAQRFGYEGVAGVVIAEVEPNSPAGEKGLRPGMLIVEVEHHAVPNVAAFKEIIAGIGEKQKLFLLLRIGNSAQFVHLERWED